MFYQSLFDKRRVSCVQFVVTTVSPNMAVLAVVFALDLGTRAAVSENARLVAWESAGCTNNVFLEKARKSSFLLIPKLTGKV